MLRVANWGRLPYDAALAEQRRLVEDRRAGRIPDTLIWVEHDPVYTLGRRAPDEHVLFGPEQRERLGIALARTDRGGEATYHGPGQLVGYPILALGKAARQAVAYVTRLEETLLRVLSDFGLTGTRDRANRGVWIGADKIAAIGVRIAGGVTMHGFALNVRTDLHHYEGIVPCGMRDRGVTSLHRFVPAVTLAEARQATLRRFVEVFGFRLEDPALAEGTA